MALRQDSFGDLKVPLTWISVVALIVCGVVGVSILLSDRRETFQTEAYGVARQAVDTVAAPVGGVVAAPGRWTGDVLGWLGSYIAVAHENRRLKGVIRDLQMQADLAVKLEDENGRLRAMLGVRTDPPIPMVTARVVADSRGPFANARLANAGSEVDIVIGYPVLSERGLVGRVVGVSRGASRVLLLTDVASRTPVMIDRSNARAILTGDGGPNPKLDYLRGREAVREGDRVLTSGDGGVMPRGLPVGRAVKGLDGRWRVVLDADSGAIDWVRILKFKDYVQLADQAALAATRLPPVITETPDDRIIGVSPRRTAPTPPPAQKTPAAGPPPQAKTPAATPPRKTAAPSPTAAVPVKKTPATITPPQKAPLTAPAGAPLKKAPAPVLAQPQSQPAQPAAEPQ
ncbi:MAG: rod shape-determining protein MreC [Caulobacter sp.]|nr:rod shape-determining protein MreC [Caulobacter sp.]